MEEQNNFLELLKRFNILTKEYKRLQSEHNVLLQVHMKVINDCLENKFKLLKRIEKLKEDKK